MEASLLIVYVPPPKPNIADQGGGSGKTPAAREHQAARLHINAATVVEGTETVLVPAPVCRRVPALFKALTWPPVNAMVVDGAESSSVNVPPARLLIVPPLLGSPTTGR